MAQIPQSLKEQLNSLIHTVMSRESEWEKTKKTCNDYRERVEVLQKSNEELQGKQEQVVAQHTSELREIDKILDDLLQENVGLKKELEMEREIKDTLVEEYTQMRQTVMGHTELLKEKPVAVNSLTTGVGNNPTKGEEATTTPAAAPKRRRTVKKCCQC